MSGLFDKAKEAISSSGKEQQIDQQADKYLNEGIDQATDRTGLGDKYDSKIDTQADKYLNKELGGSSNTNTDTGAATGDDQQQQQQQQ